ncbi:MAG: prepilin-type N-terminal cleavage/methylation domain-containing protein [Acidobacteriaceae bacterium]|nr:prepilin-type N-terminal cleavage/methylation domain-containing protein [Acidobacteriaceae bacterium]
MSRVPNRSRRGFSLIELMVSLTLGLLITGAAVKLYTTGVDATWVIQQRAELQQDLRSAEDMLIKDVSLAGAGLTTIPGESVPLPNGGAGSPVYGCSAGPVCAPNGAVNYPNIGGGGPTLYPIMPGFRLGIIPPGSVTRSDLITVVYSDNILALNCYSGTSGGAGGATAANNAITFNAAGNVLTFTAPVNLPSVPAGCVLPPNLAFPQALNNTVNGLQPGDLILFGPLGVQSAVAEVTGVAPANPGNTPAAPGSQYTISFLNGDTLNMNQSGVANDLTQFAPAGGGQLAGLVANRIFVVTYYIGNWTDAAGNVTTILYRQVNGQRAIPLVDNVANLQFTYDSYDNLGNLLVQAGDAGESVGDSPNLIRKINVIHLTVHSQLYGSKSSLMATQGFQSFDLQTSISARNASFTNRY